MDERKRLFNKIKTRLLVVGFLIFSGVSLYAATRYYQNHNLPDPRSCFITTWHKVSICPKDPGYILYRQIPDLLVRALILSEDASFFSHEGLDWFEIKESLKRNWQEGRYARGGSTISQQLVKNLYLTPEKSLRRKLNEFFIAKKIETKLSKKEILEKYLNVIEFGDEIYGLSQATHFYFGKQVSQLNLLESIYLVSIIPNPKVYGSSLHNKRLSRDNIQKMNIILKRLYQTKRISDEELVYSQTLLETEAWPFDLFSPHHFDFMEIPNVQSELENEVHEMEIEAPAPPEPPHQSLPDSNVNPPAGLNESQP